MLLAWLVLEATAGSIKWFDGGGSWWWCSFSNGAGHARENFRSSLSRALSLETDDSNGADKLVPSLDPSKPPALLESGSKFMRSVSGRAISEDDARQAVQVIRESSEDDDAVEPYLPQDLKATWAIALRRMTLMKAATLAATVASSPSPSASASCSSSRITKQESTCETQVVASSNGSRAAVRVVDIEVLNADCD